MERDVVCGMQVDPATAKWTSTFDGHTYYFCGKGCQAKFDADPARYLTPGSGIRDPGSVRVEPRTPRIPDPGSRIPQKYTCPMHPEIIRDAPGSCPICGMALEPRMASADEPVNPELVDMTRRFWVSVVLTIPLVVLAMLEMLREAPLLGSATAFFELALATP